ncbi:hypothetical protein [Streptomyces sp. NBC_01451]|uniref:hypothetical protein n=1 Tax=Streptomyces sp. NBC_01451 TaxID=2903872 RepID=UPI002E336A07|nr:hypothetical protein [Streptomyces sp. NBC_01451]
MREEAGVNPEEQHPRLFLLSQAELDADPYPDEPFRIDFAGYSRTGPDGTVQYGNLKVRLNSADIAALKAQIRAAELAYASRLGRMTDEQLERARAREVARAAPPPSTDLLELVLVKLRAA